MSLPVQPRLFDVLSMYAKAVERGEVKPGRIAATSPALIFCENFYAQFFQNELKHEIKAFTQEAKTEAVRLRMRLKKKKKNRVPRSTIQLITWFEKLCDIYPTVLAMGYGGGTKTAFVSFHSDYLVTLLKRVQAWAKTRKYERLETKSETVLAALEEAIEGIED